MEQILNIIPIDYTNNEINGLLKKSKENKADYSLHFTQNEDFFLNTWQTYNIPHIPIHHDIHRKNPDRNYISFLKSVLETIIPLTSPLLYDTEYFFDPAELLRPCFYKIYNYNGSQYIYIIRLDLSFKPNYCDIIEMGNNDISHFFSTKSVFLDADIHPVEKIIEKSGRKEVYIKQSISQTWIGETGRGYFIQGIWIDTELTKFFSRLFIDKNTSTYPYYPFSCKFRTVSHSPVDFSEEGRKKHISLIDSAYNFIYPYMKEIEKVLKNNEFSMDLPLFQEIKSKTDPEIISYFSKYGIRRYLNEKGMKEYELEY